MRISLITATYNRTREVEKLFESLSHQSYSNFELILVDQNQNNVLDAVVDNFKYSFKIIHLKTSRLGLSYNRNVGLEHVTGNVVGFPDDDCYYSPNVLESAVKKFEDDKVKFVLLKATDNLSKETFIQYTNRILSTNDILKLSISFNVFVRFAKEAKFDEKLGVGAYYGSGEETDYLWSIVKKKDIGRFAEESCVYHPSNTASTDVGRAYKYGLGFGAIFKKQFLRHRDLSSILLFIFYIGRSVGGILFSTHRSFYYYTFLGRLKGFMQYK